MKSYSDAVHDLISYLESKTIDLIKEPGGEEIAQDLKEEFWTQLDNLNTIIFGDSKK